MRFFSSIHLLLLVYTIAALVWWEIALQKQSRQIYIGDVAMLKSTVDSVRQPQKYGEESREIQQKFAMRTDQYAGEGATFLIVILIGAAVVYTSFRRRIMLSRQQNNFMMSVTHELKSPIAAMKLNLQTLEKHRLDDERRKQLLERCIKESTRLNDLCNNLLFASQLEGRKYRPAMETFNLSEIAEDIVTDYAARYSRNFAEDIYPGCILQGDRVMLQMALGNLVENAVKYTPADKTITLTLQPQGNHVALRVMDEGPGIPDNEKQKIFNKFYRVGNEGTRKTKGTGLGLYLTKRIIDQHKGHIAVRDNMPAGTIFEVTLPSGT